MTSTISSGDAASFCPLVLHSGNSLHTRREWWLSFQLRPEPRITLKGVTPTRDEIIDCLKYLPSAPVWMIDLMMVGVGVAERSNAALDSQPKETK